MPGLRLSTRLPHGLSHPLNFPALYLSSPGTLPYEIKIVIAGNHELTFDQEFMADLIKQDFYYFPSALQAEAGELRERAVAADQLHLPAGL
ncbi:hypothetical protein SKAU_G00043610 [Synaphobranchus kaupii]|uniref:Uncharacterized protein n=1 Tax=Synaphobranchus kaupii TaxID=118154 RepID=A0A9Q1G205_SYNKA|nr:hypothetical protein SKAU_G00043610 [Synaphobranchus kaupii]